MTPLIDTKMKFYELSLFNDNFQQIKAFQLALDCADVETNGVCFYYKRTFN